MASQVASWSSSAVASISATTASSVRAMFVPVSPSGTGYTLSRLRPWACSRTVSRKVLTDSRRAAVFNRSSVGTTGQHMRHPAAPVPRPPRSDRLDRSAWRCGRALVAFHGCPDRRKRRGATNGSSDDPSNVIEPGFPAARRRTQWHRNVKCVARARHGACRCLTRIGAPSVAGTRTSSGSRAQVNGAAKRVNVCTGCIKSGKIVKAG